MSVRTYLIMLFLFTIVNNFVAALSNQSFKLLSSSSTMFSNKRRDSKDGPVNEDSTSPRETLTDPSISYNVIQERKSDVALTTISQRLVIQG